MLKLNVIFLALMITTNIAKAAYLPTLPNPELPIPQWQSKWELQPFHYYANPFIVGDFNDDGLPDLALLCKILSHLTKITQNDKKAIEIIFHNYLSCYRQSLITK